MTVEFCQYPVDLPFGYIYPEVSQLLPYQRLCDMAVIILLQDKTSQRRIEMSIN